MAWGFERGRVYNRRADIHDQYGGQRQGGIITPADHPLVIIITGEEGLAHGYADRYRADGVFEYFGEGQVGDMAMVRGNHSMNGRSLLLFRKLRQGLRFEGEMVYEAHHIEECRIEKELSETQSCLSYDRLRTSTRSWRLLCLTWGSTWRPYGDAHTRR